MGEIFNSDFVSNQKGMDRLELSDTELKKHGLKLGDLIFARRSYVREGSGKCSVIEQLSEPLVPESSIIRARPDKNKVVPKYLYYFFKSRDGRNRMNEIVRQTSVSGIAQSDLKEIQIPVPPIATQERIVETLFMIDTKIKINNRINTLLGEILQTIFEHYFVHFGDHDELRESKLGKVPSEWKIVELGEFIDLNRGYSYTSEFLDKENNKDGSYPMINLQNVMEGGGFDEDGLKYYTKRR